MICVCVLLAGKEAQMQKNIMQVTRAIIELHNAYPLNCLHYAQNGFLRAQIRGLSPFFPGLGHIIEIVHPIPE